MPRVVFSSPATLVELFPPGWVVAGHARVQDDLPALRGRERLEWASHLESSDDCFARDHKGSIPRGTRYDRSVDLEKENLMKRFLAIFVPALAVVAVGVTAAMHGEADDAPGLALLGILLIVGALAAAVRTAQRSR